MPHTEVPYCPVAASADVLGDYWTLLIVRELLRGETHFNELVRNLPGISRTLLTHRLRTLEGANVVDRAAASRGRPTSYRLTSVGRELEPVINVLADWGARFAMPEPSAQDLDPDVLLWLLRGRMRRAELPSQRVVIEVDVVGGRGGVYWLVLEPSDVSLCVDHPGFDIDLYLTADLLTLYYIWMRRTGPADALLSGALQLDGPKHLVRQFPSWFVPRRQAVALDTGHEASADVPAPAIAASTRDA